MKKILRKCEPFYPLLAGELQKTQGDDSSEKMDLGKTVRRLRQEKGLTGVQLCRRAGSLDPKTLSAVEKGRIQNPTIRTLLAISKGLGVTIADLFRQTEREIPSSFYLGSQKGAFQMEFRGWKIKVVSFTPFTKDFFCGKLIFDGQTRLDETLLKHPLPFFISTLVGRFQVTVEGKTADLKEGDNLFFNGALRHSFYNPLHRESVLLLVTAPSFF